MLFFAAAGRALFNTLLPPVCYACGCSIAGMQSNQKMTDEHSGTDRDGYRWPAPETIFKDFLCGRCTQAILTVQSPLCGTCGKMFTSREGGDHRCEFCTRHAWAFSRARSAGLFDRSLAALVHRFKYSGRVSLAGPLGILMLGTLLENWQPGDIDCIVPVPLHRSRLRRRGFNQSFLLTRGWMSMAARYHIDWPSIPVDPVLLNRIRPTASQTGLGRKERVSNLKNAFAVNPDRDVAHSRLLLVDDVFTTGSTVNECARVLLKAGARRVEVLTLARTPVMKVKING